MSKKSKGTDKAPNKAKQDKIKDDDVLRLRLIEAQYEFHETQSHAVLIFLAGLLQDDVEDTLDRMTGWMDPRNIRIHALDPDVDRMDAVECELYPVQWRYWRRMSARGNIAVLLDGPYRYAFDPNNPLPDDADQKTARRDRAECFLSNERVRVIKLWLDRSDKNFEKTFDALDDGKDNSWQVTKRDRLIKSSLKDYRKRIASIIDNPENCLPWITIDMGEDTALDKLCQHILGGIETPPTPTTVKRAPAKLDTGPAIVTKTPKNPKEALRDAQADLRILTDSKAFRDRSLIIAFEGHDAAGKGGAIRRLVRGIDPRHRHVIPISAPTSEELLYPYLWRFWRDMPAHGNVAIFDRSWYGRVLVERVEGLIKKPVWQRAYGEINDMESELVRHGGIVVKFWLDISAEEQKKRFEARQTTTYKQFKITEDDWRNASKRNDYEKALSDLLAATHTQQAPWTVVPADDKDITRAIVAETVATRVKEALKNGRKD